MNSARVLFFLHTLLVTTLFVVLLTRTGTIYASNDLNPTKSVVISTDGDLNTHSYVHERLPRHGSRNESQKAFDQSLPSHFSMANPYAPFLAEVAMNCSQSVLKASPIFSTIACKLPRLLISMASFTASAEHQTLIINFCRRHLEHAFNRTLGAITSASPLVIVMSSIWLYFSGSFFFDVGHYTLHKFSKSKSRILRNIGYLHEVHHLYFNRKLKFNDRYRWQNMCFELPLELFCQLLGTWLGYLLASFANLTGPGMLSEDVLILVLAFEVIRSTVVACMEGRDSNHKSYSSVVPKDPHTFLVGPEYHALHHVDPSSYISSSFKVFDWMLGTSTSLRSRRVTTVGSLGTFGVAMKEELLSESVSCIEELQLGPGKPEDSRASTIEVLRRTDILVLGSNFAGDTGMDDLVELFKKHQKAKATHSLLLPEIWCLDTGANTCPSLGNQGEETATESRKTLGQNHRMYYDDEEVLYRHIICGSRIEWLNSRPEWAAKIAMWWIRRGARTVPTTFDFLAVLMNTHGL